MAKDPNKINPKPKGKLSFTEAVLFIIVILIALYALGGNVKNEPDPHKPVPTAPSNR